MLSASRGVAARARTLLSPDEVVRGITFMGRIDRMSCYISGVLFKDKPINGAISIVGTDGTGCMVASEVKERLT